MKSIYILPFKSEAYLFYYLFIAFYDLQLAYRVITAATAVECRYQHCF